MDPMDSAEAEARFAIGLEGTDVWSACGDPVVIEGAKAGPVFDETHVVVAIEQRDCGEVVDVERRPIFIPLDGEV